MGERCSNKKGRGISSTLWILSITDGLFVAFGVISQKLRQPDVGKGVF
jgi:hypothetical protein